MRRGGIFDCMSWPEGPIPLLATPALLAPRHRGGGNARVHHAVALVASGVDPAAFAMGTGADRTVCACSLSNRLIGPAAQIGEWLFLSGPSRHSSPLGPPGQKRFGPLPPYKGLSRRCDRIGGGFC